MESRAKTQAHGDGMKFRIQFSHVDLHGQVSAIGGRDPHGRMWRLPVAEVSEGIAAGNWAFTVLVDGVEHDVVATPRSGLGVNVGGEVTGFPVLPPFPAS